MKLKSKSTLISLLLMVILITLGVSSWKIARDEIFYLCGNFSAGVAKSSVNRQLDTANLSRYKQTINESGSSIIFSSRLYFVTGQCIIELDKNDKVVSADYQ